MEKEPKEIEKEETEEIVPSEEEKKELESLLKAIKELEENKNKEGNNKKKGFIAIEFGGVFHHNLYINFVFTFILNLTLAFILIQIFHFASYDSIIYITLFLLGYTLVESVFRIYVLMNHFQLIVKSLGFVFFFGYVFIFFALDQYIFGETVSFINETLFVVFVGMFTIVRYVLSYLLRQNFRKRNLR
jgi:hypothetical protein